MTVPAQVRSGLLNLPLGLDLVQPFPGIRLGSHRIPVALALAAALAWAAHRELARMLKGHPWTLENALPTFVASVIIGLSLGLLFAASQAARKIAQSSNQALAPGFRRNFLMGFQLHLMSLATIVVAGLCGALTGLHDIPLLLIAIWLASLDVAARPLRRLLTFLLQGVAFAALFFFILTPNALFRFADALSYKLSFLVAMWAVVLTSMTLVAAACIRPLAALPLSMLWFAAMSRFPDVWWVLAPTESLRILYGRYPGVGLPLSLAAAASAFLAWTLLDTRKSVSRGSTLRNGTFNLRAAREALSGLATGLYGLQLSTYIRQGWGGRRSLLSLGLGPAIHVGTAWLWTLGLSAICLAFYAFGFSRFLESAGALFALQWILMAVLLSALQVQRRLADRSAEVGLLTLLPGVPGPRGVRRLLAQWAFVAVFAAGLPLVLASRLLVDLPSIPDYPHLFLYRGRNREDDYWLVSMLMLLIACLVIWRNLDAPDWRNLGKQSLWWLPLALSVAFAATLLTFIEGPAGPALKLVLIAAIGLACLASFASVSARSREAPRAA